MDLRSLIKDESGFIVIHPHILRDLDYKEAFSSINFANSSAEIALDINHP